MIRIETYAGHKIRAVSAKTALILWYINISENIARNKIYEFTIADDPELFLIQMLSCIERTYNVTVTLNDTLSYEAKCVELLNLLHQYGNVRVLKVKNHVSG